MFSDLGRMYQLVSRIQDGLGELKSLLESHIFNQGLAAIEKCGESAINVSASEIGYMTSVPQKCVFYNLCNCHTKRRISRWGPANPSFGMTPYTQYNLWRLQITNLKSVSDQNKDWWGPAHQSFFDMTTTKILKDLFLRHTTPMCCCIWRSWSKRGREIFEPIRCIRLFWCKHAFQSHNCREVPKECYEFVCCSFGFIGSEGVCSNNTWCT